MTKQIKIFTGSAILVNRLATLLDEKKIKTIIKDSQESGRLAGFGTTGSAVELFIYDNDLSITKPIIENFKKEITE